MIESEGRDFLELGPQAVRAAPRRGERPNRKDLLVARPGWSGRGWRGRRSPEAVGAPARRARGYDGVLVERERGRPLAPTSASASAIVSPAFT